MGHRFNLWSEMMPHAAGQLNPYATATELMCLEHMLYDKRSHHEEKLVHRD